MSRRARRRRGPARGAAGRDAVGGGGALPDAACALAKANGVNPPYTVYAGQVLAIPRVHAAPGPHASRSKPRRRAPIVSCPPPKCSPTAAPEAGFAVSTALARCRRSRRGRAVRWRRADIRRARWKPRAWRRRSRRRRFRATDSSGRCGARSPAPFGAKPNGARNDGINIRAAEGTPVLRGRERRRGLCRRRDSRLRRACC